MVKTGSAAQHAAKALDLLRATRFLLQAGMPVRAASDAYYAVFHIAEALLATVGLGAETHAGVHTLLARHFVKNGQLPSDTSQRFSYLMSDRLNADYGVDQQIDDAGGHRAVWLAAGLALDMLAALREADAGGVLAALRAEAEALRQAATPPPAAP